ncbi:MAG: MFS transporter [Deltaproteobacteria bacterium]|nr:MFS transporter [Deltaproteobacteria bacterium]
MRPSQAPPPLPSSVSNNGGGERKGPRLPFIARQFPPFSPRQWRVFGISTTAGFFDNYDTALLSLALRQIQRGLGIAEARLGATLSLIRIGYLMSLALSPLADVFGRRQLLLYTIVGYTIFTGMSAVAPHTGSFVAAQFAARAFSGAEATVSLVILAEEVDAAVRGWALGMQGALSISGYGLAAIAFGMIRIIPFGWRGLYALALFPLALIIPLRRILPESRRFEQARNTQITRPGVMAPLRALLRSYPWRLLSIFAVVFLGSMAGGAVGFFVPKYLQEIHHWSPARVSSLYVFGGALGIIGNIAAGRISDGFGRRIIGPLFIALEAILAYQLYTIRSGAVVILWIGWLFCDQAGVTVSNAYSAELFPTTFRSAAAGALYVARYSGGALGLLGEGMLYGVMGSHWAAIRMLTLCWLFAAALMYLLFPETARRELEEIAPSTFA